MKVANIRESLWEHMVSCVNEYENSAHGIDISADGTKLYITGTSGDGVDIFTMTTPFDITTASWSSFWNSVVYGPRLINPQHIQFKYDGTKVFFASSNLLKEYGLVNLKLLRNTSQTQDSLCYYSLYLHKMVADKLVYNVN